MRSRFLRDSLWVVALLVCSQPALADVVILKDGFTLRGKVRRESTKFVDPASGQMMVVPKGFFMIDDEARRIYFSHRQIPDASNISEGDANRDADQIRLARPFTRASSFRVPPGRYAGVTPWDDKWQRDLTLDLYPSGKRKIEQSLTILTPYFARIDARRYSWSPHYLTRELDPELVREAIYLHPDFKITGGKDDAVKRFRIVRFLTQAEWYESALAELERIAIDMPDQKEKVESTRGELKKLLQLKLLDLIEQAQKVGRHAWARAKLAAYPRKDLDEATLARIRALQTSYDTVNKNLDLARRSLNELPLQVTDSIYRNLLAEAVKTMLSELNAESVNRLETFLNLTQQAIRNKEQNRTVEHGPEQLLALAVSGWLLGNGAAGPDIDMAVRLWKARHFILEHQRTHNAGDRQTLLTAYQKSEGIPFDELAQVIRSMPPPEPMEDSLLKNGPWVSGALPFAPAPVFWALHTAQRLLPMRLELQADLPWAARRGPTYALQLPPEYHHGRAYPIVFVLHDVGETTEQLYQRWSVLAAQHGYILVIPEWDRNGNKAYSYTAEEQRAVTEVLRDLRQHVQVDSDRVFVTGIGEGANMAYDVGLSHPDQFAGIIPVSGRPRYFAKFYWRNAQYLPFYVVDGDLSGELTKENRQQFEHWIERGYPALWVQYKGRGQESFEGEVPNIFDWMDRKKRAAAFPELGRYGNGGAFGDEFQSMRSTDSRFYWLRGEELHSRHVNDARKWNATASPAILQAQISEGNQLNIHARGFKRVTAWLGMGMIDFDKPLKVYVNVTQITPARKITPSLATLLEDFYATGDRQRLYWAKLEFGL